MDGESMLYRLRQELFEDSTSGFMDTRTSYDYLYEAVCAFVEATNCLSSTQTITTVASTSTYILNADYMCMYLMDSWNQFICRFSDGAGYYWPIWTPYNSIIQTSSVSPTTTWTQDIPNNFSIIDTDPKAIITSTATSTGAASLGQCTLTDTTKTFSSTISPGDAVHNITDGSNGVVLSVSTTTCVTALFGGTANDWTSGDTYKIVPQGRKAIIFDPVPAKDDYTVTFYYTQRPIPVYSQVGLYRIDATYIPAIVKYAAWLYRYRDSRPDMGDRLYQHWENAVRKATRRENRAINKQSWRVNFTKRTYGDRSFRF